MKFLFSLAPLKLLVKELSIPNFLTASRLFLAPFIFLLIRAGQVNLGFALFLIAGITDWADGFLARNRRSQTTFGALFDPIADKILITFCYLALTQVGKIPLWLTLTVFIRDGFITGGVLLAWTFNTKIPLQPIVISKINTFLQIILCIIFLQPYYRIIHPIDQFLFYTIFCTTVTSGLMYAKIFITNYQQK